MNRTERLHAILQELRAAAPRGRSSTWLAARFEVSPRTIKRDMAALHDMGVGLVAEEGRGGGYALDRSALLPPLAFTAAEATAVAVAIGASPDLPFRDAARSALARLLGSMSPEQRRRARQIASRLWVRGDVPRERWARVLDEAIATRRVVHIDYVNGDGTMTRDRPVEPMALARTRHHWHLLGWCRLREGPRWFRTDRVMRAHLTHEVAPPRDLGATFGEPPDDARPIELG